MEEGVTIFSITKDALHKGWHLGDPRTILANIKDILKRYPVEVSQVDMFLAPIIHQILGGTERTAVLEQTYRVILALEQEHNRIIDDTV